jgi:hypothetical protein
VLSELHPENVHIPHLFVRLMLVNHCKGETKYQVEAREDHEYNVDRLRYLSVERDEASLVRLVQKNNQMHG